MTDVLRNMSPDSLVESGVKILTPAIEHVYAVLVRVGVLAVDE